MPIINKLARIRKQNIRDYAQDSDSFCFFNVLTSDDLLNTVEYLLPEHRERDYPPTETLSMFLAQSMNEDRSCQKVVNDAAIKRLAYGLPSISTATGGYCRARKRLPTSMISELVRCTGERVYDQLPQKWLWRGKRVCLVDGTTATMPDTPENQAKYPQSGGQKEGLGFPICRIVGITCLASGAVLNAAYGKTKGKGSTEQALIREICRTFNEGDLVLGDAFYSTYFFLAWLIEHDIDAVFEQHGSRKRVVDFRTGQRLGTKDHILTYSKPKKPYWMSEEDYALAPSDIKIRELKVGGKVLITTMLCAKEVDKTELKELYKKRWNVELDFRDIKTTMGMETLSCKSPEMIEKELWVYLLAYNLIRLLMSQSALLNNVLPRQLSFKHTLQLWLSWRQCGVISCEENIVQLSTLIAQKKVANRPGRMEPRAVKRRPKPMPLLTKKRGEARAEITKNGHPAKLK
jgi:hypothetical protein